MKQSLLILSGPYGEGHRQAAQALMETCKLSRPDAEAAVVDFMDCALPRLSSLSKKVYHRGVETFPSIYGYLFSRTRRGKPISSFMSRLHWDGLERLVKLLEDMKPSITVSTFPIAAAAMSALKTERLTDVPAVTVITDHTDHSFWIHPGTDLYIVGSEKVRRSLNALGIPDSRIAVTGIPIRPRFHAMRPEQPETVRARLGLDPHLPTVLIMGGGYGMLEKGVLQLLGCGNLGVRLQFVVICGYNEKLRQKLAERFEHGSKAHEIRLTGFVQNIEEYMAAADLIITKPGGLTTAEAVAMKLPMVLYRPLPGQEEDNAEFLIEAGVAMMANDEEELEQTVAMLMHSKDLLHAMRQCAQRLEAGKASYKALDAIFSAKPFEMPDWQKHLASLGI